MTEKRIYRRMHLVCYLKVLDKESGSLIGHVVDITPEGLMVMSETKLEVDKIYHFRIMTQPEGGEEKMVFNARCRWCRRDSAGNYYDSGFELVDLDKKKSKKIEEIINTLCFSAD